MAKLINVVKPMVFENPETKEKITVEYNREAIYEMDEKGVISAEFLQDMSRTPLTTASTLFYYGLRMHHPEITKEEARELLFDKIGLDSEILNRLGELFMTPYTSIMEARKNSAWTMK